VNSSTQDAPAGDNDRLTLPHRADLATRRAFARALDFITPISIAVCLAYFTRLAFPVTWLGNLVVSIVILTSMICAFLYLLAGEALLPNTLGRWVLGVRVVDKEAHRPSFRQAVIRTLSLGIWPIEFLRMLFDPRARRYGDRAADTVVMTYAPRVRLPVRIAFAFILIGTALFATTQIAPAVEAIEQVRRAQAIQQTAK
jgi:uncharacterized RDD family membrane protein YckC